MKKRCFLSTTAAFKLKTATPYANNMGLGATLLAAGLGMLIHRRRQTV
jgi:hypothetical protein